MQSPQTIKFSCNPLPPGAHDVQEMSLPKYGKGLTSSNQSVLHASWICQTSRTQPQASLMKLNCIGRVVSGEEGLLHQAIEAVHEWYMEFFLEDSFVAGFLAHESTVLSRETKLPFARVKMRSSFSLLASTSISNTSRMSRGYFLKRRQSVKLCVLVWELGAAIVNMLG
jgi:hypothetical protein